jgi:transcriptional regulator of acetoin/glycerol metabolism
VGGAPETQPHELTAELQSDRALSTVRLEIAESWRRSAQAGLSPTDFTVPLIEGDVDGLLIHAARPVIAALTSDLSGIDVSVVVSDAHANVLGRTDTTRTARATFDAISLAPGFVYSEADIGTNAIGTALATSLPVDVVAHEHFSEALAGTSCAAAPIKDPRTGATIGVVDLSCRAADASPMMLVVAKAASREMYAQLAQDRGSDRAAKRDAHLGQLTRGERRVAVLLAEGRSNREIANELFVSPYTVDAHARAIYRKLDVHSRIALARLFSGEAS